MRKENKKEEIMTRLRKLEGVVFNARKHDKLFDVGDKKFVGISGGLRFLASKNFFNSRKSLAEIKAELVKNNYFSSLQAVQSALNRLSGPGKILITFKEGGKKFYAKRK